MTDKDTTKLVARLCDQQHTISRGIGLASRLFAQICEDAIAAGDTISALALLLDEDRLEEIITDSIDLDWTPRTAARAIVRAMKGNETCRD